MSILTAKQWVDLDAPVPFQGGALGCATVIEVPDGDHRLLGAEYLADTCADGGVWDEFCYVETQPDCEVPITLPPPANGFRTFENPTLVEGSPFACYGGIECNDPGSSDNEERAMASLMYSKSRQIDLYLSTYMDTNATVDLGDVSVFDAIMQLENTASMMYGAYPIIYMSRAHAVCAFAQNLILQNPSGGLMTINGTCVANIAAPDAIEPDKMFMSGRLTLIAGPVKTFDSPETILPDGTCVNKRALAEQIYVPLFECFIAEANASCDGATPPPTAT